ncbi:MAG: tetratricopeptide repeat protein [Verrucomicrobia bacterium]|nr:tetratricopeptide repeat protein [Verrucomicrobiota bacterium]
MLSPRGLPDLATSRSPARAYFPLIAVALWFSVLQTRAAEPEVLKKMTRQSQIEREGKNPKFPPDSVEAAREHLLTGDFPKVIKLATTGVAEDGNNEEWPLLLLESLIATGQYTNALGVADKALESFPYSIRLRLMAHEVFRHNGQTARARGMLEEVNQLATGRSWAYREPPARVALGRVALLLGADPKRVLELFYDPVRKSLTPAPKKPAAKPPVLIPAPEEADTNAAFALKTVYLATGQLALDKNDSALAGKTFGTALKQFPNDPDLRFGYAQAFASGDTEEMFDALQETLNLNTNHVGARLLLADYHIDSESYAEAQDLLDAALKINPHSPEALAYKSVLANLDADTAAEKKFRGAALKFWTNNPAVDHLIGRKLSQKYRFAEGAARQRQALKFDPDFLPAKIQLATDLLRLGKDADGWMLAEEVNKDDPYDVLAYNLVTLKDAMSHFRTLTNAHFIVHMDPKEADIYGANVLALLDRARTTLTAKYGLDLKERVTVEIFPQQKDFAIRTFGMPGGAGFLGVCFGSVITANSPQTRPGSPSNWEAILWHEFCHVVTLQLTKNKMPRWLSEGISVYEEWQGQPAWGEKMTSRYREMLLAEELTPVSELSGAFLSPKSPLHLQFAYYESALVVEFLLERFGVEALRKILADLATGVPINKAIAAHAAPMKQVDHDFAERARTRARETGPGLDWTKPSGAIVKSDEETAKWIAANPTNFYALKRSAELLIEKKQWAAAKEPLQKLVTLYPQQTHDGNAYELLARVHRELKETAEEQALLTRLAEQSSDSVEAYARLMELDSAKTNWPAVLTNAARLNAVNPLTPTPHFQAAAAHEALGQKTDAVLAYDTVLKLDPQDPAEVHFRLARLLHGSRDTDAKRHVLMALEEAPRFRAAQKLLLEMGPSPGTTNNPPRKPLNF